VFCPEGGQTHYNGRRSDRRSRHAHMPALDPSSNCAARPGCPEALEARFAPEKPLLVHVVNRSRLAGRQSGWQVAPDPSGCAAITPICPSTSSNTASALLEPLSGTLKAANQAELTLCNLHANGLKEASASWGIQAQPPSGRPGRLTPRTVTGRSAQSRHAPPPNGAARRQCTACCSMSADSRPKNRSSGFGPCSMPPCPLKARPWR